MDVYVEARRGRSRRSGAGTNDGARHGTERIASSADCLALGVHPRRVPASRSPLDSNAARRPLNSNTKGARSAASSRSAFTRRALLRPDKPARNCQLDRCLLSASGKLSPAVLQRARRNRIYMDGCLIRCVLFQLAYLAAAICQPLSPR